MRYLILFTILFCGCIEQTVISTNDAITNISDYKNGVLYFPYIRDSFAKTLSAYKEKNPDVKIISICGDGNGTHGRDTGYFVIVEQR